MNVRKSIPALFSLLFILGTASAATDTQDSNVSVTIGSLTAINIDPSSMQWQSLNPGQQGNASDEATGYTAIQIENIGSTNMSHVWINATYPSTNPFGSGSNANYDAGNFVVLANQTSEDYLFPSRWDYNETGVLYYIKDPNGQMPPSGFNYGRFRNASNEYFWLINNTGACNDTGKYLHLGSTPHNSSQSGTTDFTGSGYINVTLDGTVTGVYGSNWAYGDIASGPMNGYCVAVNASCDAVIFYKWNIDAPGGTNCANAEYAWNSTSNGPLYPGKNFPMMIKVNIPYGVPEGTIEAGTLTVIGDTA